MRIFLTTIIIILASHFSFGQDIEPKKKKGKIGFKKAKELVIDYQYDDYDKLYKGGYIVMKNDLKGLIDVNGQTIFECQYEELRRLSDDHYFILDNGKAGILNEESEIIVPFEYQDIDSATSDFAIVKKDDKWYNLNLETFELDDKNVVFKFPDDIPLFGDCNNFEENYESEKDCSTKKMLEFIYLNTRYPSEAMMKKVEGTVMIRMIIDQEGEIQNPEIVRDIGAGCGEEALRVVEKMPTWIPGRKDGKAVGSYFNLPIKFKLK